MLDKNTENKSIIYMLLKCNDRIQPAGFSLTQGDRAHRAGGTAYIHRILPVPSINQPLLHLFLETTQRGPDEGDRGSVRGRDREGRGMRTLCLLVLCECPLKQCAREFISFYVCIYVYGKKDTLKGHHK